MKLRDMYFYCWLIGLVMISSFGCNNKPKKIILPANLPELHSNTNLKMMDLFEKETKVVAFFRGNFAIKDALPRYKYFIEKYPHIGFIFYINYKDEQSLINYLESKELYYPIFYDPNDTFLKENNPVIPQRLTFMGFIVNSKNEILKVSNPSLPDFKKMLKRFANE